MAYGQNNSNAGWSYGPRSQAMQDALYPPSAEELERRRQKKAAHQAYVANQNAALRASGELTPFDDSRRPGWTEAMANYLATGQGGDFGGSTGGGIVPGGVPTGTQSYTPPNQPGQGGIDYSQPAPIVATDPNFNLGQVGNVTPPAASEYSTLPNNPYTQPSSNAGNVGNFWEGSTGTDWQSQFDEWKKKQYGGA